MRVEINYKDGVIESPEEVKKKYIEEISRRWHEGFKKHITKDLEDYLEETKKLNENEEESDRNEIERIYQLQPKPETNNNTPLPPNSYAII